MSSPNLETKRPSYKLSRRNSEREICGTFFKNAQVVKLVDTQASEACGSNSLEVQILSWAHESASGRRKQALGELA